MKQEICTIGFAKKSLEQFVNLMKNAGVTRLVDTRLNNTSQLSGYAKKNDLSYVMRLVGISYQHDVLLAPTENIFSAYKKKQMSWDEFEKQYVGLLEKRKIENRINDILADEVTCFLCSEDKPHHCHRRLLAEYLNQHKKEIKVTHLV
ncbi:MULTISPECIES: DUF488 domain-containing protein [Paenibacillus]|uniref:DUF488 domain-containing protein n=1 Tax=Paenibacillus TaxID=44249 RepID=UPI00040F7353|nr:MULTISPECIES: DUF488 domain-containing protein [Paenibacillus]KGP77404.1 hypothetical protein P364_0133180 [Paenibacillus sp. MAEPY2]KGP78086.1 hypothetical protein P363_0132520 [Paenibacillus sp. MAEPY1]OZQ58512.1 hypothetical protein CA599_31600 [Paenibacillus taichungensis]